MGLSLADLDRKRERERVRRLCVGRGLGAAAVVKEMYRGALSLLAIWDY